MPVPLLVVHGQPALPRWRRVQAGLASEGKYSEYIFLHCLRAAHSIWELEKLRGNQERGSHWHVVFEGAEPWSRADRWVLDSREEGKGAAGGTFKAPRAASYRAARRLGGLGRPQETLGEAQEAGPRGLPRGGGEGGGKGGARREEGGRREDVRGPRIEGGRRFLPLGGPPFGPRARSAPAPGFAPQHRP